MLLHSLRALCIPPGEPESISNYLGAPVRSTTVPGRFACIFHTDFQFADKAGYVIRTYFTLRAPTILHHTYRALLWVVFKEWLNAGN